MKLNMDKINIKNKKIMFLGYGAVAKCVWHYFDYYFEYNINNVFIIDKCKESFYGPKINILPKSNIIVEDVKTFNFEEILEKLEFRVGDIIIDLTCVSDTYHFVSKCLKLGINYINTSIEDGNDDLYGSSIDFQQQIIKYIFNTFVQQPINNIRSNILIEFGQNPGLIQHYVLYALNNLNKLKNTTISNDYSLDKMILAIRENKIGTILMSEIDGIEANDKFKKIAGVQYNTWSVLGLLSEGLDKTELVCGKHNKFIKPQIPKEYFDKQKTTLIKKVSQTVRTDKTTQIENDYKVFFLNEYGINSKLNSICPVLDSEGKIKLKHYRGSLIHHGEIFELARLFGKDAPFMSYVYKLNKYASESMIQNFSSTTGLQGNFNDWHDTTIALYNDHNKCQIFDNIKIPNVFNGFDSIGCTLFCGENQKIDKIYWCGSLLSSSDQNVSNLFTPTIVQVAAGVLSGLSCILEKNNINRGLLFSCDLDTDYILSKSVPLLGKFFFTEIDTKHFGNEIKFKLDIII